MTGTLIDEDLAELDKLLGEFAARLGEPERRKLGRSLATELRKRNAARIGRNVTPTGEAMAPRKQPGRVRLRDQATAGKRGARRGRMFLRARLARFLKSGTDGNEAWTGYTGRMARIMRVHQLGLSDHVGRDAGSPSVKYEAREVLGISDADQAAILEIVTRHLGA